MREVACLKPLREVTYLCPSDEDPPHAPLGVTHASGVPYVATAGFPPMPSPRCPAQCRSKPSLWPAWWPSPWPA